MANKKKPIKLVYDEPLRFSVDTSALEEQRKNSAFNLSVACSCGGSFAVPVDVLGNTVTCPKCGNLVKISDEEFPPITCSCGKSLRVPRQATNVKKCPQCKKEVKLLGTLADESAGAKPAQKPEKKSEKTYFDEPLQKIEKTEKASGDEMLSDDQLKDVAGILLGQSWEEPGIVNARKAVPQPKKAEDSRISITCSCGKKIMVPLAYAGRPIKCLSCGNLVKMPEENFIHMTCSCGMEFKVPRILEGKHGLCPKCGKRLEISEKPH